MALQIGNTNIKEIYLGNTKIAQMYLGANKVYQATIPLPPNTIRVRTNDGNPPIKNYTTYGTATLVDGTTNVYDVYKSGTSFYGILWGSTNVIEVITANTTDITNMSYMFNGCSVLTSVPLFNTSSVTNMNSMFNGCSALTSVPLFDTSNVTSMVSMMYGCSSLTTVPLFDTSNVTNMDSMFMRCPSLTYIPLFDTSKVTSMRGTFADCRNVQYGALALYQQASSQTTPPTSHGSTFRNCGSDTETGAAELAQIPSDWK